MHWSGCTLRAMDGKPFCGYHHARMLDRGDAYRAKGPDVAAAELGMLAPGQQRRS